MADASSLIAKLNGILNKYAPPDRKAYKRIYSAPSANEKLTGRYSSNPTFTETLMNPQPYFGRVGREHIPGGHATWEIMQTSNSQEIADDYEFLISPTAMTLDELKSQHMRIALKDTEGGVEEFRFLDVVPAGLGGVDVVFVAYFRSLNRPGS